MRPFGSGVYVNFLGVEGEARVREAYTPETYQRLAAVKRRYDPTDFFRPNQNVKPLPSAPERRRPRSGRPVADAA